MNIENIHIGQKFKDFKCLCEALDIEYKSSGKQRVLKIEDVARHIKWERGVNLPFFIPGRSRQTQGD
jgi:hypothetical protein